MKKQVSRHVDAVLAALAILDCFLKEPVLSLRQVIKMTGLTRNRIMRLAGSLEARGYLNLDFSPAKITLGPKCLRLGKVFESHLDLVSIARPILQKLVRETGESASLYIRDGMERIVVAREEGTHMIRYSIKEGQRMPLHAGAAGKVFLAYIPSNVRKWILNNNHLPAFTAITVTDKARLEEEIAEIALKGYAVSLGEYIPDVGSMAAPVFGHQKDLSGVLSIAGPLYRFRSAPIEEKKDKLVTAAGDLSYLLGSDR